jgi:hypothetical protein
LFAAAAVLFAMAPAIAAAPAAAHRAVAAAAAHRVVAAAAAHRVVAAAAADSAPGVSVLGCRGQVLVSEPGRAAIQIPTAGPASPTSPLELASSDTITYNLVSNQPLSDPRWHAKVAGIPIGGGKASSVDGRAVLTGTVKTQRFTFIRLTGRFFVSMTVTGRGGQCSGSVWLKFTGNPLATVPFWIVAALTAAGFVGLYWALPRARLHGAKRRQVGEGAFAGLIIGIGGTLLLILLDAIAFLTWPPYLALVLLGPVFGVLVAAFGPAIGKPRANDVAVRPTPTK